MQSQWDFIDSEYKSNWRIAGIGALCYIFMFQLRHLVAFPRNEKTLKWKVIQHSLPSQKSLTVLPSEWILLLAQQAFLPMSHVRDTSAVSGIMYPAPMWSCIRIPGLCYYLHLLLPTITTASCFKHLIFLQRNACQDLWLTELFKCLGWRGMTETAWWWPQTWAAAC